MTERDYGQFELRIVQPAEVDGDNVTASFHKGNLTVTLPQTPQATEEFKQIRANGKLPHMVGQWPASPRAGNPPGGAADGPTP